MIRVEPTLLDGVVCITPDVFKDDRGFFMETYHREAYRKAGIKNAFVQDNYSHSSRHVLRGLHYQLRQPQAKLVSVIWGEIFDVAVDIRRGSPTWGRWTGHILSEENRAQLFIPEGFAHGFCVLSERADVMYKCTDFYNPGDDYGIAWADAEIGIQWPVPEPLLSEKDRAYSPLAQIPPDLLPAYTSPAAPR